MDNKENKVVNFYENPWGSKWTRISFFIVAGSILLYLISGYLGCMSPNDPIEPFIK